MGFFIAEIDGKPGVVLHDERGKPLSISAFGDLRVAPPFAFADLNFRYGIDANEFGTSVATGGTVTSIAAQQAARLTVTATSGSRAQLRTHTFYRYQSGKGFSARWSCYHSDAGQANQTRRWGFFDSGDGVFFQLAGTVLSVVRRTSTSGATVDNLTAQASWSVDKLDGTGPSLVTLDVTKANIYEIRFQWLGAGSILYYVNGILVHETANANLLTVPYMATATLPLAADVENTIASTGASVTFICGSASSEGGQECPEYTFGAFTPADISVTTTERPILSIRPKTTLNTIVNRILLLPSLLGVSTEGSRMAVRVVMGNTLTGAGFASVNAESGAEFDVAATALSGGVTLFRSMLPNTNDGRDFNLASLFTHHARKLRLDAFGVTQEILTIAATNEAAGSTLARASLSWREIR